MSMMKPIEVRRLFRWAAAMRELVETDIEHFMDGYDEAVKEDLDRRIVDELKALLDRETEEKMSDEPETDISLEEAPFPNGWAACWHCGEGFRLDGNTDWEDTHSDDVICATCGPTCDERCDTCDRPLWDNENRILRHDDGTFCSEKCRDGHWKKLDEEAVLRADFGSGPDWY